MNRYRNILPKFGSMDLMVILALAVVMSILKTAQSYVEPLLLATGLGWFVTDFFYGLLVFPGAIAAYKIKRLGSNFLVNLIQGFVSLLLGAPMSIFMVIYACGWGVTSDAIMGAFLYKRRYVIYLVAGFTAGVVTGILDAIFFREWLLAFGAFWLYMDVLSRILGGAVGFSLGYTISVSLERAGLIAKE